MSNIHDSDVKEITIIRSALRLEGSTKAEQEKGAIARRIIDYYTHDGKVILSFDPFHKKITYVNEKLI